MFLNVKERTYTVLYYCKIGTEMAQISRSIERISSWHCFGIDTD